MSPPFCQAGSTHTLVAMPCVLVPHGSVVVESPVYACSSVFAHVCVMMWVCTHVQFIAREEASIGLL